MRTSSFSSSDRTKSIKDSRVAPLTPQFVSQLIKLETDFANKNYNADTLDELTQFYAQAVEYYDSLKDPIASYFIFKIQDTLTTKKSLKLLMQQSTKVSRLSEVKNGREGAELSESASTSSPPDSSGLQKGSNNGAKSKLTLNKVSPPNIITENSDHETSEDEEEEEDKVEMMRGSTLRRGPNALRLVSPRKSITTLKNKKQKLFTLQLKIHNEKHQEKQNLAAVLASFGSSAVDNDSVVKSDIEVQKNKIKMRMANRKKNTFVNQTNSSIGYLPKPEMTIENVLKGLDDQDSLSNSQEGQERQAGQEGEEGLEEIQDELKKSEISGLPDEHI